MPDHWDTRPEDLFTPPVEQPDPAPNAHDDIALVIAAAAILLVAAGLMLAPG